MNASLSGAIALSLIGVFGCDAPRACSGLEQWRELESESLRGSFVLSERDEEQRVALRATLADLPELWPGDGNVPTGRLHFEVRLAYEDMPADGTIQMPRLSVGELQTPSFPPAAGLGQTLFIFAECPAGSEPDCCPFGARECVAERNVSIRRIEGEPFPPVEVSWTARVSAGSSPCPLGGRNATLSLELVEP